MQHARVWDAAKELPGLRDIKLEARAAPNKTKLGKLTRPLIILTTINPDDAISQALWANTKRPLTRKGIIDRNPTTATVVDNPTMTDRGHYSGRHRHPQRPHLTRYLNTRGSKDTERDRVGATLAARASTEPSTPPTVYANLGSVVYVRVAEGSKPPRSVPIFQPMRTVIYHVLDFTVCLDTSAYGTQFRLLWQERLLEM